MSWVALVTMQGHHVAGAAEQAWAEDALIIDALRRRGIEARHARWADGPHVIDGAVLAIVRTPWDYTWQSDAFLAWVDAAAARMPVWNPPGLVRWNAHKSYLFDLEARGVPITPGVRVRQGATVDLAALLARHEEIVIKPVIDAGAMNAIRIRAGEADRGREHLARLAARGDVLVQPYLRRIEADGERSLLYFGGDFSHAVRKVPARGDWRVQRAYGGTTRAIDPSPEDLALAKRTLGALDQPTLHARVDVVTDNDGRSVLIELEAIEPYFFLRDAPGSADRYASAVEAAMLMPARSREPITKG